MRDSRKFLSGFLAGFVMATVVLLSCTAYAASIRSELKTVYYRDIKITVNGEEVGFDVEPFIVEPGWTMVQVEPLVKKMGWAVKWNDHTSTLEVASLEYAKPPETNATSTLEIEGFLNAAYGSVETELGTLNLHYEVTGNVSQRVPYDYDVRMHCSSSFFKDLENAPNPEPTLKALRDHARLVYEVLQNEEGTKRITGTYFQESNGRHYLSWRNYETEIGDIDRPGSIYGNARVTEFHFTPFLDVVQF